MAHVREVPRKGGKRAYEVRWRDLAGKNSQRTFTVRREAERFAARIENELAAGDDSHHALKNRKTIQEAIDAVLAADRHRLKPRTLDSYRKIYGKRITEKFGNRRLNTLKRGEIQHWITELAGDGLAAATVKHHYLALRKLFKWAIRERLLTHDPCEHISLPRRSTSNEYPILSVAEIQRLAEVLEDTPPYGLLVRFMAYTGLRLAEVAGLRVSDVELGNRRLFVRQTAQRITGRGWVLGAPKSKRSTREVPLLDSRLIADLKTHLLTHPDPGRSGALFWPGRSPGSRELDYDRMFDGASFRRNRFSTALIQAKLPKMRLHDLRHTAASLWLAAGFQPYEVSRWLGHASVTTTDTIYGHLYPTNYRDHMEKFERYMARETD
ncbi:site-specific integrase [Leucobacter viscericola]|uniref:Site-specific integrase n=1 Tax=Leucobacter viscericola TaxID=2714935 RepID=A0A6G7XEI6_9MICO|nr:tyrosine-type recombinase/integrase [Leucobacter viscericola]QIK62922.1 site-specific integrase [Leucobacter viscericola]